MGLLAEIAPARADAVASFRDRASRRMPGRLRAPYRPYTQSIRTFAVVTDGGAGRGKMINNSGEGRFDSDQRGSIRTRELHVSANCVRTGHLFKPSTHRLSARAPPTITVCYDFISIPSQALHAWGRGAIYRRP